MAEKTQKTLLQKLCNIQKSIKTFAVSEDSDKKNAQGKSEYRYTPGWEIVEKVRELMDNEGVMLLSNCVAKQSTLIDYPVYKNFAGRATSFLKKEMYVEVTMEYTWYDIESGDKFGPFTSYGFGANGTDKSGASAISLAKRYFLLNFFNFTTHEAVDEPDAHDSGYIHGLGPDGQPLNLPAGKAHEAVPATPYPAPQGGTGNYTNAPAGPAAPANAYPGGMPQPVGGYQGGYAGPQPAAEKGFNPNDPGIRAVISVLANYDKGTASHKKVLNENLGRLKASGYNSNDPNFVIALVEAGQAIRIGQ